MANKSNPQIRIPRATFEELEQIADVWGLPSPGLVIPVMVKQFGHLMRHGLPQVDTSCGEVTQSEATSCHSLTQADTDCVNVKLTDTECHKLTQSECPADEFFNLEFDEV